MSKNGEEKNVFVLYKNGKFYNALGVDAYILNYYFGYKVLDNKKAGFPESAIQRVKEKLEEEKISYQIISVDKNPCVKEFKKLNKYQKVVLKVRESLELNKRIDLIIDKLKQSNYSQMEDIIERIEACFK